MKLVQAKSESRHVTHHLALRDGLPIDRAPMTLSPRDTLRDAVAAMTRLAQSAIPVVTSDGRYLGLCTMRSIADMCLPVAGALMTTMPTAAFVADSPRDAHRRISGRLDESVASFLDASAPALELGAATSVALVAFYERHLLLPVVDREQHLIGVVHWHSLLEEVAPAASGNGL
jgi:CBS domain-containing protein